jgi:hypothetical protein
MEYVTKAAVERGLVPVYWDNGGQNSGGENFGLFDRRSGKVLHPALLEAMIRATSGTGSLSEIRKPSPPSQLALGGGSTAAGEIQQPSPSK